ncbi:MAG: phosphoethanolamine transferase domain-containing protein [Helicobacteraceae bacterium]|jgi:glucan phosphoethanolaminetransferase (alkaline phosphatase superfamily)|nr:phosphoethanolamine transferase domain-containing protein [Helicobacteraceae bacterium]
MRFGGFFHFDLQGSPRETLKYTAFVFGVSFLYTLVFNLPYYNIIFAKLDDVFMLVAITVSFCAVFPLIFLIGLRRKVFAFFICFLLITSAVMIYYTIATGILHNRETFFLFYETNIHEVKDVISAYLIAGIIIAAIAAFLLCEFKPDFSFKNKYNLIALTIVIIVTIAMNLSMNFTAVKRLNDGVFKGKRPMPYQYVSHFYQTTREVIKIKKYRKTRKPYEGNVMIAPQNEPVYVIFALGESVRADHLKALGYDRDTTPNLSALKNEGGGGGGRYLLLSARF